MSLDLMTGFLDATSPCEALDFLELRLNQRRAARMSVYAPTVSSLVELAVNEGYAFAVRPSGLGVETDEYGSRERKAATLNSIDIYLARSIATVDEILEACQTPGGDEHVGELFGYPTCCVRAFLADLRREPEGPYPLMRTAIGRAIDSGRFVYPAKMSPLLPSRVIGFFPCAFDCPAALKRAESRLKELAQWSKWRPPGARLDGPNQSIIFTG